MVINAFIACKQLFHVLNQAFTLFLLKYHIVDVRRVMRHYIIDFLDFNQKVLLDLYLSLQDVVLFEQQLFVARFRADELGEGFGHGFVFFAVASHLTLLDSLNYANLVVLGTVEDQVAEVLDFVTAKLDVELLHLA
jgi:hypothetical protein